MFQNERKKNPKKKKAIQKKVNKINVVRTITEFFFLNLASFGFHNKFYRR